ncbi:hypothetical protein RAN3_2878 [plant metagenome]|uniref:Uncharacterized protein n=1 Tax=plant metagenome TaxID=1297885 RepID=A0A484VI36_9ZZZZ
MPGPRQHAGSQACRQRGDATRRMAQCRAKRIGIGGIGVDQASRAGQRIAQAGHQSAHAQRETGAVQGAARIGECAAHRAEQVVHGHAQAGVGSQPLRDVGDRADHGARDRVDGRAHAAQRGVQAQGRKVVDRLSGVGKRRLQDGLALARQQAASHAAEYRRHRMQQASFAAQRVRQCTDAIGGMAQDRGQRREVVRAHVEDTARAAHGIAQAAHQPAHPRSQRARQACLPQGVASVRHGAADLGQQAVDRRAQARGAAQCLGRVDQGRNEGLDGGVERRAHRAQGVARARVDQVVHRAARIAERGFEHAQHLGRRRRDAPPTVVSTAAAPTTTAAAAAVIAAAGATGESVAAAGTAAAGRKTQHGGQDEAGDQCAMQRRTLDRFHDVLQICLGR